MTPVSILGAGAFAIAVMAAGDRTARASETYPARNVSVIFPGAPGASTDPLARALILGLTSRLKQQFVLMHREGGGGAIGAGAIVRSEPDGYTVGFLPALVIAVLPLRQTNLGFNPQSLEPVCQTFSNTMAIAVRKDSSLKSVADLVETARARKGELAYGHLSHASIPHFAMTELALLAKVEMQDVPFRGGDPAVITALLGGHIGVAAIVLGSAAGQDGLRLLGTFGEERNAAFPDVPTVREQGFDVAPASFGGIVATPGTPSGVKALLEQACAGAARDEAYVTATKRAFQPASYYADSVTFGRKLAKDIQDKARIFQSFKGGAPN